MDAERPVIRAVVPFAVSNPNVQPRSIIVAFNDVVEHFWLAGFWTSDTNDDHAATSNGQKDRSTARTVRFAMLPASILSEGAISSTKSGSPFFFRNLLASLIPLFLSPISLIKFLNFASASGVTSAPTKIPCNIGKHEPEHKFLDKDNSVRA